MLNERLDLENYIHRQIKQIMKGNPADYLIHSDGVMQLIDENDMTGNNRKYLEKYNKMAKLYRLTNAVYFLFKFGGEKRYRNSFLSELEIKSRDKVLETSVGAGDNFKYLPKNVTLYGVDLSYNMLKQAVKNTNKWKKKAYYFQGNAEVLPFKDESFDVVFHVGGINFFNDKRAAIIEMVRVAKSGTKIVIVDEMEKITETRYEKKPITKDYYGEEEEEKVEEQTNVPLEYVPNNMQDVTYKEICKGLMYCLTFRKP